MKRAFTIIELLLYLSIVSVMLFVLSLFLQLILQSRVKNQAIAEVEQQGLQVMQRILQTARNAEAISSPLPGGGAATASFDVEDAAKDPTVFELSGGAIRIASEGTGPAIALTNSRVAASSLSFTNLSRPNTPGAIRVQFTLNHINPENRSEYSYFKTFYGTASLR